MKTSSRQLTSPKLRNMGKQFDRDGVTDSAAEAECRRLGLGGLARLAVLAAKDKAKQVRIGKAFGITS